MSDVFSSPQNIRVMAKYYTRVRIKRMSELLDLTDGVSLHEIITQPISVAIFPHKSLWL